MGRQTLISCNVLNILQLSSLIRIEISTKLFKEHNLLLKQNTKQKNCDKTFLHTFIKILFNFFSGGFVREQILLKL